MTSYRKKNRLQIDRNLRISTFSAGWWFYIALTAAVLYILTVIYDERTVDERYTAVLILSIIELIVLRIYKFSLRYIRPDYNYFNELPCYLCNQSTILCIVAAMIHDRILMGFCVSAGTLGALLAFLMPDSYNRNQLFFSAQALGFYGYHSLLIVTCLSFHTLGLYVPAFGDVPWILAVTFILTVIAHIFNVVLSKMGLCPHANYIFTMKPDNAFLQKLYDRIPVPLLYLVPLLPVVGIMVLAMLAILKLTLKA